MSNPLKIPSAWIHTRAGQKYLRFWTHYQVAPEVLSLFRLCFFAIMAVDMWMQVVHAPRYGVSDFNVAHLLFADDNFIAQRGFTTIGYLFLGFLAGRFALGGGGPLSMRVMAGLYGAIYFSSQLDSYQHHYLMFLVLLLSCFVPWDGKPEKGSDGLKAWPIRLILIQISIVYAFAALSKMESVWWSGEVMTQQVEAGWARTKILETGGGFGGVAKLVVFTELFLAVALHVRLLRIPAAVIGIGLHIGVEVIGLKIGLFSYFMMALYLLVLPERPLVVLVRSFRNLPIPKIPGVVGVVAWLAGGVALATLPFDGVWLLVLLAMADSAYLWIRNRQRSGAIGLSHLAAAGLLALLAQPSVTDVSRDYYRFWGGQMRRMGDVPGATAAYERATAIAPNYAPGHSSLGKLYYMAGDYERAIAQARKAQTVDAEDFRGYLIEAMVHHKTQNGPEALRAANASLAAKENREARRIAQFWQRRLGGDKKSEGKSQ